MSLARRAMGGGTFPALAVCLALPIALHSTRAHVVPMEGGVWHGLTDPPSLGLVLFALAAGLCGAALLRRLAVDRGRPLLALGLAGLPLVSAATGLLPALLVFQGPALVLVVAPGLALLVLAAARRAPTSAVRARWLLAIGFLFYAWLGTRLPGAAGPQGDEPHYLTMAESLRSDLDLDLTDEFASRDYAAFFAGSLQPHRSPSSPRGRLYAVHPPGLPVLILPAYAAAGYPGVRLFLSFVAALTAALGYRLARDVTRDAPAALGAWAILVFTPPLPFYAVAVYPETPAALGVVAFLVLARGEASPGRLGAAVLVASALPWLHPKFLPMAALGLFFALVRGRAVGPALGALLLPIASVGGLLAWHAATYGRAAFDAAYGPGADVDILNVPRGLLALALDRQFGLLPLSPAFLLAATGGVMLWRRRTGDAVRSLALGASVVVVGASFGMWWGGACPPARFLVPALPAMALLLTPSLRERPRLAAALFGFGAAVTGLAAWAPRALHNFPDGESALWRTLSPAVNVDALLPSFVGPASDWLPGFSLAAVIVVLAACRGPIRFGMVAGYLVLAAALTDGARVDEGPAALALLTEADPGNTWSPNGEPDLARLSVPAGDRRRLRGLDLPPGTYELEVRGGGAGERVRLRADELPLLDEALDGSGERRFPLVLPLGARRLTMELPPEGRAAFVPRQVVPRSRRHGMSWPVAPQLERYRVGSAALRVTALDRSELEGDGFRIEGGEGRFLIEVPEGSAALVRLARAEPAERRDAAFIGERVVSLAGPSRSPAVPVEASDGVALGDLRLVPIRILAAGALVRFEAAAGR